MRALLSLLIVCVAPISAYLLGREHALVIGILIASAGQLLYALQGPLDSALTARERLDYTAAFSIVNQLVFWGLGVLFLVSGMGFIGLILASLIGVGVATLLSGWALFFKLGVGELTLSVRRWPGILLAALPFGASSLAGAFLQRFDTLLMSIVLTDAEVGWYNAPYSLIMMMLLLAQSIAIALYPSMVRGYRADSDSLTSVVQRAIKYLLFISLPIVVGGSILADRIVLFLYTDEFASSIVVLRVALWALPSLFLLEVLGRTANALHMERPAAKINIVNAVITVVLNLILVPTMGVLGGALALVLGRALRLFQFWLLIGHKRLVEGQWSSLLRGILAAGLMGAAVFLLRGIPLLPCIGIGAGLYVVLILGLRAVDIHELRYLGRALIHRGEMR
jgi:O-antigen/teichoic acid export membrane protein